MARPKKVIKEEVKKEKVVSPTEIIIIGIGGTLTKGMEYKCNNIQAQHFISKGFAKLKTQ